MRHFRIFILHCQNLLAHPGRPTIFAGLFVFNCLVYLAFFRGVFQNTTSISGWNLSSITGYYFLLIIASATLMTHPEISILRDDIEKGELAGRLLKPFSYFWLRFYYELPYRLYEGVLCIGVYFVLTSIFGNLLGLQLSGMQIFLVIITVVLAYFISFTFKLLVATTGLFTTDIRGLLELMEVVLLLFGGYIVPLNMLPSVIEKISYALPFSYIIYFPVIAVQGKLPLQEMARVICNQAIWFIVLIILFRLLWNKGLRKYTDFGH